MILDAAEYDPGTIFILFRLNLLSVRQSQRRKISVLQKRTWILCILLPICEGQGRPCVPAHGTTSGRTRMTPLQTRGAMLGTPRTPTPCRWGR